MISSFLTALRSQLASLETIQQAAHDLGAALHAFDDASLRELRNELVARDPDNASLHAAISVLVEVIDGYRAELERVRATTVRDTQRDVLDLLAERPHNTSELADKLRLDDATISRTLTRLRTLALVDPPLREASDRRRAEQRLSLRAEQAIGRLDRAERAASSWHLSLVDREAAGPDLSSVPPAKERPVIPRTLQRAPLDGAPPRARKPPPNKPIRTTTRRPPDPVMTNAALLSLKKI